MVFFFKTDILEAVATVRTTIDMIVLVRAHRQPNKFMRVSWEARATNITFRVCTVDHDGVFGSALLSQHNGFQIRPWLFTLQESKQFLTFFTSGHFIVGRHTARLSVTGCFMCQFRGYSSWDFKVPSLRSMAEQESRRRWEARLRICELMDLRNMSRWQICEIFTFCHSLC